MRISNFKASLFAMTALVAVAPGALAQTAGSYTIGSILSGTASGSGTTPGGVSGQVQINQNLAFAGISNVQLTTLINQFSATASGAVPASGGGNTTFLRADGTWAIPAGSGGGSTSPGGNSTQVQYNNNGVFGGLTGAALTADIAQFSATTTTSGAVPGSNGVGATYFLNGNGGWAVPAGSGGGGSYTLPAATNSTLGGVIASTGLAVNGTGQLSVSYGTGAGQAAQGNDFRITSALSAATAATTYAPIGPVPLTALINAFSSTLAGDVPASGGGTTTFLRADGTWSTPAGGAAGAAGTSGQVQANLNGALSGLTNTALTALINQFSTTASGAVPLSPGGATAFLRADGSWATPPNTVYTLPAATNSTLGGITPSTGLAVNGSGQLSVSYGTGAGQAAQGNDFRITSALSAATAATTYAPIGPVPLTALINQFSSTLSGDVPASGGGTTSYLRADGTWATPASGSASAAGTSGQVQANLNGSFTGLTNAQLTGLINAFSSTTAGCTPASGGGTTTFLRADGTWQPAPGGASTPGGTTGQVQINSGGTALGGITNAQLTGYIVPFTTALSGAVPASGGGVATFMRADGTWASPVTISSFTAAIANNATVSTLTVSGTVTGTALAVGQILSGTNVPFGTYIVSGSGTSWVVAQPSGAVITTASTTISAQVQPLATGTTGQVQANSGGLTVGLSNAQLTADITQFSTTGTTSGAVPGSNGAAATSFLNATGAWSVPAGSGGGSYTLPAATTSALGGVSVGSGLAVTGAGQLSATQSFRLVASGATDTQLASDNNTLVKFSSATSGTLTETLLACNSARVGFATIFKSRAVSLVLSAPSGSTIDYGASYSAGSGSAVLITCDGAGDWTIN